MGTNCAWVPVTLQVPVTVWPLIMFGGKDITGTTQSVVVGQQIALSSSYVLPPGITVKSRSWTVAGTTVGGFNHGNTNGGPVATNFTQDSTTFYWVAAGTSLQVTFTLTLSDNSTPKASTTFNVAGPTAANIVTKTGAVQVASGPVLQFGNANGPIGIGFTASATPPAGYSNNFSWVQKITSDQVSLTPSNGNPVLNCVGVTNPQTSNGSGLDNVYPYDAGSSTADSPALGLSNTYKEETESTSFTMYLLWSSGLPSPAIPVPLGYVTWQWNGDATLANSQWGLKSGSGSASAFQASTSYPNWSSLVEENGGLSCH